jgi:uncharacterized NAD-dependent epimerase/dehydratase family protein
LKSSKGKIKWKTKHIELDTQLVTYFSLANAIGNVKENYNQGVKQAIEYGVHINNLQHDLKS